MYTAEHSPEIAPSPEQAEVERLRHGIAVLNLFDAEVAAEDRRTEFLHRTHPGTESRETILQGKTYKGDETRLNRAISKAQNRYAITALRLEAMEQHAVFIGIEVAIRDKRLVFANSEDETRLGKEHGKWRQNFASRYRTQERGSYREFLQGKIGKLLGEKASETPTEETLEQGIPTIVVGPHVNIEERAFRLTKAINNFAWISMLSGFGVAVEDDRYSRLIHDRYKDGTRKVDRAARNKSERLYDEVEDEYWFASGFQAIRESDTMPNRLLQRRSKKMWDEFKSQYMTSYQQGLRVATREQLAEYLTAEQIEMAKVKSAHKNV